MGNAELSPGLASRALSIRQPWVELILLGRKRYELRSWRTFYRGLVLLHAGQRVETEIAQIAGLQPEHLLTGCYVGVAEIAACRPFDPEMAVEMTEAGAFFGEWEPGLFAWELAGAARLPKPVAAKGRLGLYKP